MEQKKSKLYTRQGDNGTTGLGDGSRVEKNALRIETIGSIDELNSLLGLLLAHGVSADVEHILLKLQNRLFDLGSDLALVEPKKINRDEIIWLEQMLDRLDAEIPPLRTFILPGGSIAAANLHHARTVCRRTERRLCQLASVDSGDDNTLSLQFLNRLSDLLFILARTQNIAAGVTETCWEES